MKIRHLCIVLFLLPTLLFAEDIHLEEIEVTASRTQVPAEPYRVVALLDHAQIASLPVTNIADILAYLPGVDIRSRGASQAQSDMSMRGGTADQVLILINGIPVMDTQTGHYAMNIPICPALIERIEVLQDASSSIPGAFTGAIQIITRDATQDRYGIRLSAGTDNTLVPSFDASWKRGEARINTGAEYARRDAFYYRIANLYLQTRWRGLDVQAGAQYKDADLGMGYGFGSADQFDATRTLFASGRYIHPLTDRWTLTAQAAYRTQHDRYEWHRGTPTNTHWTHHVHASLQAQYASSFGRTTFGATFQNEYIRSSNMGIHNRWQASLHAGQHFYWQGLTASVGLAGHYHAWCGWYASGDAHIGYAFLSSGYVGIAASRSLRMPTWTDLYYKAGVQRGSTSLRAEKAWQIALNTHYTWSWQKAGKMQLYADLFHRWGQDIIDWTYNESDALFYATNHNQVNTFGIECGIDYQLNRWLRDLRVQYAYTTLSLDLVKTRSNYLDYLRHKLTVHLNHGIYVWSTGCLGADWSLRWQQREGTYVDADGTAGHPFTPVLLFDGSLYLELTGVRIAIEGTNITNRSYYDYGGVLMPGIHAQLTLSLSL